MNRFYQIPHLTHDIIWKSDDNTGKHHIQKSQEVNPFPTGDHKEQTTQHDRHETQITKKIHKISNTLERSVKMTEWIKKC